MACRHCLTHSHYSACLQNLLCIWCPLGLLAQPLTWISSTPSSSSESRAPSGHLLVHPSISACLHCVPMHLATPVVPGSRTYLDQLISPVSRCIWSTFPSLAQNLSWISFSLLSSGVSGAPCGHWLEHSPRSSYLCPLPVFLAQLLFTGSPTHLHKLISAVCRCVWRPLWSLVHTFMSISSSPLYAQKLT